MLIEIGSHRFPGFYETLFCNSDEFIDDEEELEYMLKEIVDNDKFEVSYEYDDFEKYKKDICKRYLENYVEKLIDCLPFDIHEKDYFQFEIIDDEDNITVVSPKYYNYSTDKCYCLVKTNKRTLKMLKNFGLMDEENVVEYLFKHFTSHDGFISFINNNIGYWESMSIEDYIKEGRYLIALLDMIIALDDPDNFEEIYLSTYYDTDKYCYAEPIVYCNKEDVPIIRNSYPNLKLKTHW